MVRTKNPNYPLMTERETSRSESFGSLPSDNKTDEIQQEMVLPAKKTIANQAVQVRSGKKLRILAESQGRDLAEVSDFMGDDNIEVDETDDANTSKKRKRGAKDDDLDIHQMFIDAGFASPVYPHVATMKNLGVYKDVDLILRHCGLETFYKTCHPAYPKYAAEFLATLKMHHFPDNEAMLEAYGGGMITFKFEGKAKQLEFKKINEAFGFDPGEPKPVSLRQEDKDTVWELLTGEDELPQQPKATSIRNPAISYARKVIAQSFHCRRDPGNINVSDMEFLTIAFDSMFDFLRSERDLQGDQANAGLAYLLCKHLDGMSGKLSGIIRNGSQPKPLLCGGIITALLKKAGVPIAWETEKKAEPVYMNIEYLRKHGFLANSEELEKFYYKYIQRNGQPVLFKLPNTNLTEISEVNNINFEPPEEFHVNPSTLFLAKTPITPKKADAPRQPQKKKARSLAPAQPCICTSDGYEEKMVARLTTQITQDVEKRVRASLRAEMRREVDDEIQKGLAELKRAFEKRLSRTPESSDRRAPERQRDDTTPAPTRRADRPPERTTPTTPAAPSRQKPPVRVNSQRPAPPPPKRT